MRAYTTRFTRFGFKNLHTNSLMSSFYNKQAFLFSDAANLNSEKHINVQSNDTKYHYPIRGFPSFSAGKYTVFENKLEDGKLALIPYEIKECAMKGFLYTFFTAWVGRSISAFNYSPVNIGLIPAFGAALFLFQYGKAWHYMANSVTKIELLENGTQVRFEFKNFRKPLIVDINRIKKSDNVEKTILESYAEPYLLPITIDYEDIYGKSSFKSTKKYFIYGDSHTAIKDGEIFRAIINAQSIKLK